MLPATNGKAISRSKLPVEMLVATLANDTNEITANDVGTIECVARSVYLCKAGTMTNPPPTPSKPDRIPAMAPDNDKALAQLFVQINRPLKLFRTQGGASSNCT